MALTTTMQVRRLLILAITLVLGLALIGVAAAIAGNMSFQSGGVKVGSVIFDGVVIGVGADVLEVNVSANAIVTAVCTNKGGNQASGRNPINTTLTVSKSFTPDENGKVIVEGLTVADPTLANIQPAPTPKTAGCPNGNWKVTDVKVSTWTIVTVTATDLAGEPNAEDTLVFDCTGVTAGNSCPQVSG
jgi:hypothetical protein